MVASATTFIGAMMLVAFAFIWISDIGAWFFFRLAIGFSAAGTYIVVETWINDQISSRVRGVVMTAYTTTLRVAMTIGQAMVALPLGEDIFFAVCGIAFALAFIPIAGLPASRPTIQTAETPNPLSLFRIAPVAALATFGAGLLNLTMMNLGPVYAIKIGYSTAEAALLAAAMQIAAIILTWPLGWLSDRIDRRLVILGATVATLLGSCLLLLASRSPVLLLAGFCFAGGFSFSFYSTAAAHGFDSVRREGLATVAGALMLMWGIGSIVGPLAAAWCMEWLGPEGLPAYVLAVSLGLAGFTGWRAWRKRARPQPPESTEGA
jgi:MFS family permease